MNFERCCWALELGIPATKFNYSNKKTSEVVINLSKDRQYLSYMPRDINKAGFFCGIMTK